MSFSIDTLRRKIVQHRRNKDAMRARLKSYILNRRILDENPDDPRARNKVREIENFIFRKKK